MISGKKTASVTTATVTAIPAATPTPTLTIIPTVTATPTQTESSSIPPSWHPETPTNGSIQYSAALGQEWTAVLIAIGVLLGIVFGH